MSTTAMPHDAPVLAGLLEKWWVVLLRGLAAIGFGVLVLTWPALTFLTLVLLFGTFAIADGVLALLGAAANRGNWSTTWRLAAAGLLGVLIGVVTVMWPTLVATGLVIYAGIWAIARGILDIVAAVQLRRDISWLLLLSGLLSIVFGILVFMSPGFGVLALVWLIGLCAIATGILLVIFALRLRSLG
jgi:uncharacterized membrane protein HdeD (DUF308 family)